MKTLSSKQIDALKLDYKKKGYIIIKHFFRKPEQLLLKEWTKEIIEWPETIGKWLKYFESVDRHGSFPSRVVLSRIENFVRYHKGFSELVDDHQLLSLLSDLLGERVTFFKEKLNVKAPGAKGYSAHQDAPAFFDIEYDAITILTPIDAMNETNGCLFFVENGEGFSEKMLEQNTPNRALSQSVIGQFRWVPIACEPGDVIIFSSYTPHYSITNKSDHERKVLFLTFGRLSHSEGKTKQYFDVKRKLFPQDCEKLPGVDYSQAATIYSFSSPVNVNLSPGYEKIKKGVVADKGDSKDNSK